MDLRDKLDRDWEKEANQHHEWDREPRISSMVIPAPDPDLLICPRRIYNFRCSMLDYISVQHLFIMFLYRFGMIYGTNLLT